MMMDLQRVLRFIIYYEFFQDPEPVRGFPASDMAPRFGAVAALGTRTATPGAGALEQVNGITESVARPRAPTL
jgi:hypothetical protein